MRINIQIGEEIIRKARELEIYPDNLGSSLFVMLAIFEGKMQLLDSWDDTSTSKRAMILYRTLLRRGLLIETEKKSKFLYDLSKKGKDFIEWVRQDFDDELHAEDLQPLVEKSKKKEMSVEEFAEKYVALFPSEFRVHPRIIPQRLERFFKIFKEYKDFELLLAATQLYIKTLKENQGYIRKAHYFIWKAEPAGIVYDLADWCKKIIDNANSGKVEYNLDFLNTA